MDQTERLFLLELWRQAVQTLAARAGVTLAESDWPAAWQWAAELTAEATQAKQLAQLARQLASNAQPEDDKASTPARLPNVLATIARTNNGTDASRQRRTHERFHPLRPLELTKEFLLPSTTETAEAAAGTAAGYAGLWQGLRPTLNVTDPPI